MTLYTKLHGRTHARHESTYSAQTKKSQTQPGIRVNDSVQQAHCSLYITPPRLTLGVHMQGLIIATVESFWVLVTIIIMLHILLVCQVS
jgi:hypothetical protein